MKRPAISVSLIAALVLVLFAGGAAAPAQAKDSVSVKAEAAGSGQATYSGKVQSGRSKCRKGRTVQIYHDSDPPFFIGETETDADGKYSYTGISPPSGDRVFVVVKKKGSGSRRCKELNASTRVP